MNTTIIPANVFLKRVANILIEGDHIKTAEEVTLSTSFSQDLGLDSLDVIELVNILEQEYKLSLSNSELNNINTIKDLFVCINALRMQNANQSKPIAQQKVR